MHVGPLTRDGEIVALTVAAAEITERKRLEAELLASVKRLETYADALEEKNRLLEEENQERERAQAALRVHEEVIRSLSTPIIQAWEGVLALPIVGSLNRERAAQLMERLLEEIVRTQSRFAVLDLTGVDAVDTSTVGHLLNVMRAVSLLGSRCLVSGISPGIAQTIVGLGSTMEGLLTFGQMQDALRYALLESGVQDVRAGARRGSS
jgi:anti-anti-sigma regulatory factor